MNPRDLEQAVEEQIDKIPPPLINFEQVRKRDVRVYQALFIIKSTLFNWSRSPVKTLQDKIQALGLTLIVFKEDSILFCTQPFNDHRSQLIGSRFFCYNSPAAAAREVFKPSTDAESLLGSIKKKKFDLGEGFAWEGLAKWGCFRFLDLF